MSWICTLSHIKPSFFVVAGTWVNVDQSNATYNRWRSGEPNGGDIENGAIMSVYDNLDWLDYTVDSTYNFFCETNIGKRPVMKSVEQKLFNLWRVMAFKALFLSLIISCLLMFVLSHFLNKGISMGFLTVLKYR